MIDKSMSQVDKKIKVVAAFPISVGRWLDSEQHAVKAFMHLKVRPIRFMEAIFNPSDFVGPKQQLYGKILVEAHERDKGCKSILKAGFSGLPPKTIEMSKIETTSIHWQLLEGKWFKVPYGTKPILFWLYAGSTCDRCLIAICTFMLGVES